MSTLQPDPAHSPARLKRRGSGRHPVGSDLFVTNGRLTVRVLEVSDPYDIAPPRKSSVLSRFRGNRDDDNMYGYAKLGIVTQDEELVGKLYTTVASVCVRESTVLALPTEQGVAFEAVRSEHGLRVLFVLTAGTSESSSAMYCLEGGAALLPTTAVEVAACVGHTTIPLQRLESGRKVVQWYPLERVHDSTTAGVSGSDVPAAAGAALPPALRTAVKLQLLFVNDNSPRGGSCGAGAGAGALSTPSSTSTSTSTGTTPGSGKRAAALPVVDLSMTLGHSPSHAKPYSDKEYWDHKRSSSPPPALAIAEQTRHKHATAHRNRRRGSDKSASPPTQDRDRAAEGQRDAGTLRRHEPAGPAPFKPPRNHSRNRHVNQTPPASPSDASPAETPVSPSLRTASIGEAPDEAMQEYLQVLSRASRLGGSGSGSDSDSDSGADKSNNDNNNNSNTLPDEREIMGFEAMRLLSSNRGESNSDRSSSDDEDEYGDDVESDAGEALTAAPSAARASSIDAPDFDNFAAYPMAQEEALPEEEEEKEKGDVPHPANSAVTVPPQSPVDAGVGAGAKGVSTNKKPFCPPEGLDSSSPMCEVGLADGKHRVPTGLVDYVVVIGPAASKPAAAAGGGGSRGSTAPATPVATSISVQTPTGSAAAASVARGTGNLLNNMRASISGMRFRKDKQAGSPGGVSGGAGNGGYSGVPVVGSSFDTSSHSGRHRGSSAASAVNAGAEGLVTGGSNDTAESFLGSLKSRVHGQPASLWDRFPLTDHADASLGEHIEHFICPEGCAVVRSSTRPDPTVGSFLLSSGGMEEQHGVALHFYVRAHDSAAEIADQKSTAANSTPTCISGLWDDEDCDSAAGTRRATYSANASGSGVCSWYELTICALTRFPFIQQLQRLLLHYYEVRLLQQVQAHESEQCGCRSNNRMRADSANALLPTADKGTRSVIENLQVNVDNASTAASASVGPFQLNCEGLLIMLGIEAPVPIPGVYSVTLQLPAPAAGAGIVLPVGASVSALTAGSSSDTDTDDDIDPIVVRSRQDRAARNSSSLPPSPSDGSRASEASAGEGAGSGSVSSGGTAIHFERVSPSDLPQCPYHLSEVVRSLGARNTVDLVAAALAESKILFHSRHLERLPAACEALRTLLYPLQWVHVYIPVVPSHLLDLFEAPVPYILGTHSDWLRYIPVDCLRDTVIVDVDSATIDYGHNALESNASTYSHAHHAHSAQGGSMFGDTVLRFPDDLDRWMVQAINLLIYPEVGDDDSPQVYAQKQTEQTQTQTRTNSQTTCDDLEFYISADVPQQPSPPAVDPAAPIPCQLPHAQDAAIQVVIFDSLMQFLAHVPDCLFYLSQRLPIFNRALLLAETLEANNRWFLQQLTDTNAFHSFTDNIPLSKNLVFYRRAADRCKRMQAAMEATLSTGSGNGNGNGSGNAPNTAAHKPMPGGGSGVGVSGVAQNTGFPLWVEQSFAYAARCRRASDTGPALPYLREVLRLRLQLHLPQVQWLRSQPLASDPVLRLRLRADFTLVAPAGQGFSDRSEACEEGSSPSHQLNWRRKVDYKRFCFATKDGTEMWDQGEREPASAKATVHFLSDSAGVAASGSGGSRAGSPLTLSSWAAPVPAPRAMSPLQLPAPETEVFDAATLAYTALHMQTWTLDSLTAQYSQSLGSECGEADDVFINSYFHVMRLEHARPAGMVAGNGAAPAPTGADAGDGRAQTGEQSLALGADIDAAGAGTKSHPQASAGAGSHASSPFVSGGGGSSVALSSSENVTAFLTNLISDENPAKQDYYLERCLLSLSSHENRMLLIRLLRDSKKEKSKILALAPISQGVTGGGAGGAPTGCAINMSSSNSSVGFGIYSLGLQEHSAVDEHDSVIAGGSTRIFSINYSAFEALTICFLEVLHQCKLSEDYEVAFDLLEVGGLYYLFCEVDSGAGASPFLSSQIYHHPIYQQPRLWLSELSRRVRSRPTPLGTTMSQFDAEVILECHNLLRIMYDIDVNFERASAFTQVVAADYGLSMRKYFELARFTRSVYDVGGRDEEDADMEGYLDGVLDGDSDHSGEGYATTEGYGGDSSAHSGFILSSHSSSHSLHNEGEDYDEYTQDPLTSAMSFDMVNQQHLRQRRASLTMYNESKLQARAHDDSFTDHFI